MPPKKTSKSPKLLYKELGFESKKITDKSGKLKYFAVCVKCSTELTNTSVSCLEQHRNCCDGIKKSPGKKYDRNPIIYPETECKLGRHLSKIYGHLGFKPCKIFTDTGKYRSIALCLVCNRHIKNTSATRFIVHRKICNSDEYPPPKESRQTDNSQQRYINKPSILKTSLKCNLGFGKYCEQLGFKPLKIRTKSGVRNILNCLVCHINILHMTRPRLLAHRKMCSSEMYDYQTVEKYGDKPLLKPGRSLGNLYNLLGFKPGRIKSKSGLTRNIAICLVCNKEIRNTSGPRLVTHRRNCKSASSDIDTDSLCMHAAVEEKDADTYQRNVQILEQESTGESTKGRTLEKIGRSFDRVELYEQLGFKSDKVVNSRGIPKTVATCLICNVHIFNTSSSRLLCHRRTCNSEQFADNLPTEEILIETVNSAMDEENKSFDEASQTEELKCNMVDVSPERFVKPFNEKLVRKISLKRKRELSLISDPDMTDDSSITDVKEAVANFIYGCNLPLSVTESIHFKRLIRTLDATCVSDIPKKDELSNNILIKTYRRYLAETKSSWQHKEAPLVLDTVELKSGQKYYVSVLQDGIAGTRAFVNCLPFKNNLDDEDNFNKMVTESMELAKILYDTDVYAIVTDKIIRNDDPENFINVWYLTCQRYLATLLLHDLLATLDFKTCLFKVKLIVDDIKHIDVKEPLTYRDTELGPEIDDLYFLIENWETLEQAALKNVKYNISNDIRLAFCTSDFKNLCVACIEKIDFLNGFIKKLSSRTCCLADSLVLWQNFVKDPMVQDSTNLFTLLTQDRVKETKNVYSLVAHYFGEGRDSDFTSVERKKMAEFFKRVLSKEGFEEYIRFENINVPCILDRDDYYKSADFWKMLKKDLPIFANFALQMLRIPGSTGELRDIFRGFSNNCDALNKEQLRKMMSVYFSLSIKETVHVL